MLRARVAALAAAVLALAAIVAATRSPSAEAQAAAMRAGGSVHVANSKNGGAILSGQLGPGDSLTGSVTIGNVGWASGDFTLSLAQLIDTPGPNGGSFAGRLQLAVDDVTNPASPVAVYRGMLALLPRTALGSFAVGELHTYRFTVSFPEGEAADAQLVDSRLSVAFVWSARGGRQGDPPARPGPVNAAPVVPPGDRLTPPRLTIRAATRQRVLKHGGLVVRARCDQACTLKLRAKVRLGGASKAVKLKLLRRALAPGVTVKLKLKPSAAVFERLRAALAANNAPLMKLRATAVGAGGKAGPVKRTVRVTG